MNITMQAAKDGFSLLNGIVKLTPEEEARFRSKFDVGRADECWEWKRGKFRRGYGAFGFRGSTIKAHRLSYAINIGPIPEGMGVLHTCDNPPCVNPAHLFPGTNQDNTEDMCKKGRQAKGDRHNSKTHPERLRRGDNHPARLRPDYLLRGDAHPARKDGAWLRGERNGRAILDPETVRRMRAAYATGSIGTVALGAMFGVSKAVAWRVVARKSWRHVA